MIWLLQVIDPANIGAFFETIQADMQTPVFWLAVGKIIWINVLLSGDNALVIAMACRGLAPRQRLWGMVIGAGIAVVLLIAFTGIVARLMVLTYLKLVGGLALLVIAARLLVPEDEGDDVTAATSLWHAIRIVVIADIVMSLDNVIAIAASAESAAALVDIAHASAMKATLIIFGLATSVPLIVVGSAILMALLERYRVLVWGGGALLGWIAGDVMAADSVLGVWLSEPALHELHIWGGPVGGIIVIVAGYILVGKHRRLMLDEILAGIALLIWIVVDRVSDSLLGGVNPDLVRIWSVRGAVFAVMVVAYAIARSQWHIEQEKV